MQLLQRYNTPSAGSGHTTLEAWIGDHVALRLPRETVDIGRLPSKTQSCGLTQSSLEPLNGAKGINVAWALNGLFLALPFRSSCQISKTSSVRTEPCCLDTVVPGP